MFPRLRELLGLPPYKEGDNMSADNYAVVGIHPLAGTGLLFATHEEAAAYADELETEYGETFLCNCDCSTKEEAPMAEWEKERLYPATKKTFRQVIQEYTDILEHIYRTRTAEDYTWKGVLYDFMGELASTEDE